MRRLLFLVAVLVAVGFDARAQSGRVYDALTLHSDILGRDMRYAVYLPPDYDTSERHYPVLYLLHGSGDDQSGWIQFGEVLHIADEAIRDGLATPMVVIMPDGSGPPRGYFNDVSGMWLFEDYFFDEFMPAVESTYRIRSEKRYRAVAGLSMGGGGSFIYALHRPDLFSAAAPLSAYVGPLSTEEFRRRMNLDPEKAGAEAVEAYFRRHSALELIESMSAEVLGSVRWYIDCGDDDFLYEGNSLVHIALRKKDVPHEYRVRNGGHTWTYWRTALPDVLAFVSAGFHQH